jgi:hypothetical protein
MTTLNHTPKNNHQSVLRTTSENNHVNVHEDSLVELFPLPRYFQIHFQHIHDNAGNVQSEISDLKAYIAKVDAKLDQLLQSLETSSSR